MKKVEFAKRNVYIRSTFVRLRQRTRRIIFGALNSDNEICPPKPGFPVLKFETIHLKRLKFDEYSNFLRSLKLTGVLL